jgi:hypothetical protein
MRRLVMLLEMELEICAAVLSRRIRSFVLLLVAIIAPPAMMLEVSRIVATMPGLEQVLSPLLDLIGALLAIKLLFFAIRVYLKDRTALVGP